VVTHAAVVFHNATVLALDGAGGCHDAMAVADGKVLAVGDEPAVRAAAGDGARAIDLDGRVVVPGFIDAHNHFSHWVVGLLGVDCRQATSVAEIVELVASQVPTTPAGGWIRGFAYDEHRLAESRHPTRDDLDRAAPDHPVVLSHVTSHQCVANSAALASVGFDVTSEDPPGGIIVRDGKGRPTGVLYEVAAELVDAPARARLLRGDRRAVRDAADRATAQHLAFGITQICDPCVDPASEEFYAAIHQRTPLRIHALGVGHEGMFQPPDERLAPPENHDGFAISGVKLFADGAEQCALCLSVGTIARTTIAATAKALRDRSLASMRLTRQARIRLRGGKVHTGVSFYRRDDLADRAGRAAEHGLVVAVHAIGNEAIDMTLDSLTDLRLTQGDDAQLRVEHAMFPNPADIARFADLGVAAVMQPRFVNDFGDMFQGTGLDRQLPSIPIRSLLRAGITVAGSSDSPVTVPDVIAAMGSAVTRRTAEGAVFAGDEALSGEEALRLYTNGSAGVLGVADRFGSLEPGKAADFVVLSADPSRVAPDHISGVEVVETWIDGTRVYSHEDTEI
jgi:predicted amidohydrolase YtcJ